MLRLHLTAILLLAAIPLAAQPLVVTSVNPMRALVRDIAASSVVVHSLVQQSAHEHNTEITPQQAQDLGRADLIILIGLEQEPWSRALPQASQDKVLEFARSQNITFGDQHLWLDPVLVANFIPAITTYLCTLSPTECESYTQRSIKLEAELFKLDQDLHVKFGALKKRSIIAFHPAWSRFAERYKLTVVATLTNSGEEEPQARTLLELANPARNAAGVPIVVEPSTPTQVSETIANEMHSRIVTLDPQSDGEASYLEFMRQNSQRLLSALQEQL